MGVNDKSRRNLLSTLGGSTLLALPAKWLTPVVSGVVLPAHAQTSLAPELCADGVSIWLMSDYEENGVSFDQGTPQSQIEITIVGNQISLTTDWFITNSVTSSVSRGRVTDSGTIDLATGAATTSPTGTPVVSPTHGGITNLANNLDQTFTLDCVDGDSFVVQDTSNIYRFQLTRASS